MGNSINKITRHPTVPRFFFKHPVQLIYQIHYIGGNIVDQYTIQYNIQNNILYEDKLQDNNNTNIFFEGTKPNNQNNIL